VRILNPDKFERSNGNGKYGKKSAKNVSYFNSNITGKFEQNVSNIFWRFASIGRHWWPFEANQKLGC
jgi:hypothetical protein